MKTRMNKLWTTGLLAGLIINLSAVTSPADLIVVDTLPANNRANLTAEAGQTFTTGLLGAEHSLLAIEIESASTGNVSDPQGPFVLEVWTDTDGDFATWDPGTLVASSLNQTSFVAGFTSVRPWM